MRVPGRNEDRDSEIYKLAMEDVPHHVIAERYGLTRRVS